MEELAHYQEGYARVIVSRDGDELVFWSDFDDNGRSIVSESRTAVADYIAKGEGPWPWYDLRDRRAGALQVFDALGVAPQAWTEPLPAAVLDLFERAARGSASVANLLASGQDVDALDSCGAPALWYAVRSLEPAAALVLIDAGAEVSRRIELSAQGDRFTTILHEIVALARSTMLDRALARGVDPALLDSDGATPIHRLDERSDHINPGMVRSLVAAGADVNSATPSGQRPIEAAAQRLLSGTVATMLDLGAQPANALTAVLAWWTVNVRWAAYRSQEVVDVIEILRAGGAEVSDRHRELAEEAGVLTVGAALGT